MTTSERQHQQGVLALFLNAATMVNQSVRLFWRQLPASWGGGKCHHLTLPLSEGKLVCPECGEEFVGRWVRMRCQQCSRVVPSRYALGKAFQMVMPQYACCKHCGHRKAHPEHLENPDVFQMQEALLVLEPLTKPEQYAR
ncbi:MAG: hypothetical protein VKK59_01095 [Vampirovibrionales bacterium]|nr:hypothetical protein [Vampirovibrionales bacterium]